VVTFSCGDFFSSYIADASRNLRVNEKNKAMAQTFRNRFATSWSEDPTKVTPCNVVQYFHRYWSEKRKSAEPQKTKDIGENTDLDMDEITSQEKKEKMEQVENLRDQARQDDIDTKKPIMSKAVSLDEIRYLAHSKNVFEGIFNMVNPSIPTGLPPIAPQPKPACEPHVLHTSTHKLTSLWDDLKDRSKPQPTKLGPTGNQSKGINTDATDDRFKVKTVGADQEKNKNPPTKPTQDQAAILAKIEEHLRLLQQSKNDSPQLLLMIHGGPGVGKTWTIQEIMKLVEAHGFKSACTAFTGVAASLIPQAETINTTFSIPVARFSKKKNLAELGNDQTLSALSKFGDKDFIIFDEVSMINPILLGEVSQRLCQTLNVDGSKFFGGKNIILVGDFFQLKPVAGKALYTSVLEERGVIQKPQQKQQELKQLKEQKKQEQQQRKERKQAPKSTTRTHPETKSTLPPSPPPPPSFHPTSTSLPNDNPQSPYSTGVNAFAEFQLLELKEQVRAAADPVQMETLLKLRDFTAPEHIDDELIKSLTERMLCSEDFLQPAPPDDPNDTWSNAPVCVTSNKERTSLTPVLAQQLAKNRGVPLITWRKNCTGSIIQQTKAKEEIFEQTGIMEDLYSLDSGLVYLFVKGAPAYITENVNPGLGLANGTLVYLHSLSFGDKVPAEDIAIIERRINSASPGERVHLDFPPTFVNVQLTPQLTENWSNDQSLIPGEAVIPVGLVSNRSIQTVDIAQPNGKVFREQVQVLEHRVELGLVLTFHKMQGKTLKKIILELNERKFKPRLDYDMLLVGLSRVTTRDGIRIIGVPKGKFLNYLKSLKPDVNLRIWFSGFDKKGRWSRDLALAGKNAILKEKSKKPTPGPSTNRSAAPPLKSVTSKFVTLKSVAPSKTVTPKPVTPKPVTPKFVTPKFVTPKFVTPKPETPDVVILEAISAPPQPRQTPRPRQQISGTLEERYEREKGLPWSDNSCHVDTTVECLHTCQMLLGVEYPKISFPELEVLLDEASNQEEMWKAIFTIRSSLSNLTLRQIFHLRNIYWVKLAALIDRRLPYGQTAPAPDWLEFSRDQTLFQFGVLTIQNGVLVSNFPSPVHSQILALIWGSSGEEFDLSQPIHVQSSIFQFFFFFFVKSLFLGFESRHFPNCWCHPFRSCPLHSVHQKRRRLGFHQRYPEGTRWVSTLASHLELDRSPNGKTEKRLFCSQAFKSE